MLLNDREITVLSTGDRPMISPFHPKQITTLEVAGCGENRPIYTKAISKGCSSVGYDISIGPTIKHFKPIGYHEKPEQQIIDPKDFQADLLLEEFTVPSLLAPDNYFVLPGHGYCLANTPEYFRMPVDVAAICLTKSTYARCGLLVNVTPLEPEWEGHLTLELANLTHRPMKIYINEGIAQLMFFRLNGRPDTTYADRGGKYQGQGNEPVSPRMK